MPSSGSIFISYRRSDSDWATSRIYDRLGPEFGRAQVFKDVDSIPFGVDFAVHLDKAVSQCQVVLVVIGKTWSTVTDTEGRCRLYNPDDFVRIEVESALKRGIPVIPVLLEGAVMPSRSELPKSLHGLVHRNAVRVGNDPRFHSDMDRLINGMKKLLGIAEAPSERTSREHNQPRHRTAVSLFVLSDLMSRRRVVQLLGLAGGGMGLTWLGKFVFQSGSNPVVLTDLTPVEFKTVTVNSTGEVTSEENKQSEVFEEKISGISLELMHIPAGRFMMGSAEAELNRLDREGPQHEVTVASFLLGRYEVTQAQWKAVAALPQVETELNADPSRFKGDSRPVEQVSWPDAVEFCQRLSRHTGREYRLPSASEWEYACRAGTSTPFHFGETMTTDLANYRGTDNEKLGWSGSYGDGPKGEYRGQTTDVGSFPANAFGLHDMHGNVWEWCLDHWHENYEGAPVDGSAWIEGGAPNDRILRGGAWYSNPRYCRSAIRYYFTADIRYDYVGFRVSCSAPRTQ